MSSVTLSTAAQLRGVVDVPGDKSISHRAVIFNAVASGSARITNFLTGADCLSTIACIRALGVDVTQNGDEVHVYGVGLQGLREPADVLDCGNSGTTLRLLAGLLAGMPIFTVLTGDASLRSRPQRRIVEPLRSLGAQIDGRQGGDRAPLALRGASIRGGSYRLPVASAQVKSALLLAGLGGSGPLTLTGRIDSRDHTERMLTAMGVELEITPEQITLHPPTHPVLPYPLSLRVPGDPSSAAFWWVAAAIHPDAELTTPGVCLNPTRSGVLDVLRAMGAQIEITNQRSEGSEPVGDVTVRSSALRGTEIAGDLIPRLIDEIPILAVAAACAEGETLVRDAQELRAKETDRIATVAEGLSALGVKVEPTSDGMKIVGLGGPLLRGAQVQSHHDHRLAMAWAVAALVASGEMTIADPDSAAVSYPGFWETLTMVQHAT
ncbi:3-phosphoshikimate 1-carboxyvinyltransferase [Candidatus Oscillochloris fontis]|uniref:3-phosphoshikimate 1-carboxyvinyltransferase n=1 Tax=Candidatus Oscillochloris fontis TaxID=2496868 RepID=UPI00101BAE53|nr:3-phosphoshikimate 1-carboxyvinyltransferase [Candidatus Oscillochloris fontis]